MNAEEFKAAVEAVDLTAEDATAQILKLNEGLMTSNTTLLDESKLNKTKAQEANEATELARQAAATAKENELVAAGKTDELKKFYEDQLAEKTAALKLESDKATNNLIARDKGDVVNEILSKIDERYRSLVKTQLMQDTSISYDENGVVIVSIKHDENSFSSASEFLDGVKETEWKHYLTATSLSGAGTQQSHGGTASKTPSEMSTQERIDFKKRDPVGFNEAFKL
jgi:hypothetical protein